MSELVSDFSADIDAIDRIQAIPTILEVVCRVTGMGFAAVARVTQDRWIACRVRDEIAFGLEPGGELQIGTTICNEIRQSGEAVVIDHVATDRTYATHHTPAMYGFQSYISMPIVLPSGEFFGTLCAIDPRPATLNRPETIGMFKLFAELIAFHLDAGAKLLLRAEPDAKAAAILQMMQSSVGRMAGLIDNVMDFARGRLGGGLSLSRAETDLAPVLAGVMAELGASWPDRRIERRIDLAAPVACDPARIAQLFSNLLGNALIHGDGRAPLRVRASTSDGLFELSVANAGAPIPASKLERLFHPFARGAEGPEKQGLGLGLYIAWEIARAHGGTLTASSSPEETRFTFQMPRR